MSFSCSCLRFFSSKIPVSPHPIVPGRKSIALLANREYEASGYRVYDHRRETKLSLHFSFFCVTLTRSTFTGHGIPFFPTVSRDSRSFSAQVNQYSLNACIRLLPLLCNRWLRRSFEAHAHPTRRRISTNSSNSAMETRQR